MDFFFTIFLVQGPLTAYHTPYQHYKPLSKVLGKVGKMNGKL